MTGNLVEPGRQPCYLARMVTTHRNYPIGMLEDGDTYCVAIHSRGHVEWFKLHADFDLFDELDQPTLRDEDVQALLGAGDKNNEAEDVLNFS